MVYFREHRELLSDSLETEKSFKTLSELATYLVRMYCKKDYDVSIRYIGCDYRFNIGDTFICSCNGIAVGHAYLKNIENGDVDNVK